MQANTWTIPRIETKSLLSPLWIVIMINMLKADILSLYIPGAADEVSLTAGKTPITQIMLGGAVMMEIAILMIALSRSLPFRINRIANIIAVIVTTLFVVGGGASYPHYFFITAVEGVCLLLFIWFAWKWTEQKAYTNISNQKGE